MSERILFIAGTHGNEDFAVEVMQEIEQQYDREVYNYDWIIGNPRALAQGTRFTEADLNRSAPGDPESPVYESRRAAEIIQLSKSYGRVIDLHGSVAACGVVKLVPNPTRENMDLAATIPLPRTVVWYSAASEIQGPLVQHVRCPAIEIECGPQSDPHVAQKLKAVIGSILIGQLLESGNQSSVMPAEEVYSVYGVMEGLFDETVQDFQPVTVNGETFYPFMSNQYPGVLCYKMQKVRPEEVLK